MRPIVIDGGDTLFKSDLVLPAGAGDRDAAANLILDVMDRVDTDAFVPGPRDFAAGVDFLAKAAQAHRTPFVSSNVADAHTGKPLFRRFVVVERNGLKIGILGVVTPDLKAGGRAEALAGIDVLDPIGEARAVARELRGQVDVVLAVAGLKSDEVTKLAKEVPAIDVLLLSHDDRELYRAQRMREGKPAVAVQPRGKVLGNLTLFLREKGKPFGDTDARKEIDGRIARIERQIDVRKTAKDSDEKAAKIRKELVKSLEQQRAAAQDELKQFKSTPNTISFELVQLTTKYADDPEIKKLVDAIQPGLPGHPGPDNEESTSSEGGSPSSPFLVNPNPITVRKINPAPQPIPGGTRTTESPKTK